MSWFGRLVNTTAFRLAILYTVLFAGSVGALFAFVFINTSTFAERQIEAAIQAEVQGFQDIYRREGLIGLSNAINRRIDPNVRRDGVYLLADVMGRRVAGNLASWPRNTEADDLWINFSIVEMESSDSAMADVRALQFLIPGGYDLLVGRDVRDARDFRAQLLRSLNIGLGITVCLGLIGGFVISRSAMGRVEQITQTCRRIMRGDLSQRIDRAGQTDELSRLSESVNEMLDQIERLMKGLREVSDNIAHDLRTPLNRLRGYLEVTHANAIDQKQQENLEAAISEADGLLATFSALLRIARAEASLKRTFEVVDLSSVAEDVAELYLPLAEEKGIKCDVSIEATVKAWGDRNLIAQAFANLCDNAIKFTPKNGCISISLELKHEQSVFTVADSGPGIPDQYKEKVFERLFRGEESRTTAGSGLGLSLVGAVAKSHDLEVELANNNPGLKASLRFPVLEENAESLTAAASP